MIITGGSHLVKRHKVSKQFRYQCVCGFAFSRTVTTYVGETRFNKEKLPELMQEAEKELETTKRLCVRCKSECKPVKIKSC